MNRPRVLLADDHRETAEQLRRLLEPDFEVVGMVGDGRALVDAAARLAPDVIVTDFAMPELDGLAAAVIIRRCNPAARIVFVTVHAEPVLVERVLAIGALGYVVKDAAGDELLPAVQAALVGRRYVSQALEHARSGA